MNLNKDMKKLNIKLILIIFIASFLLLPATALAADEVQDGMDIINQIFGYNGKDIREIAASLINEAIGFVGIIFVGVLIIAGFKYMFSGGEQENMSKARSAIISAIIGVILIFTSYSIVNFVINTVMEASY